MQCEYCEIIERKGNAQLLFEDEQIAVAIRDNVITPGQITVFPKEHITILELVRPMILERLSYVANQVSIACFESFAAQGTNIIARNGLGAGQNVPHFGLEIIPRRENDGLSLTWQPKQFMEDEMETTLRSLKEGILESEAKTPKVADEDKVPSKQHQVIKEKTESGSEQKTEPKENYLLRSLKRRP